MAVTSSMSRTPQSGFLPHEKREGTLLHVPMHALVLCFILFSSFSARAWISGTRQKPRWTRAPARHASGRGHRTPAIRLVQKRGKKETRLLFPADCSDMPGMVAKSKRPSRPEIQETWVQSLGGATNYALA